MSDHVNLHRLYNATNLDELREAYDAWAKTYDRQIMVDYGWSGPRLLIERVRPLLADEAAIMDAGAGTGAVGLAARQAGFTTLDAMDLSLEMLEIAREHGVYRNIRAGMLGEALDYGTDSYDAVLSAGVFTPGHAPPGSFDELCRIVKPGGYIGFTMRHDRTPDGFIGTFERLADDGTWEQIDVSEPFQGMPGGEPELRHRVWLFRVL
ncbi:MAG: class I SAM-dependent methyltransferase [Rhodospirillales bacterium]|nr:class I SAM-dependent methyltransferase [Rhodospirillales bacterium]